MAVSKSSAREERENYLEANMSCQVEGIRFQELINSSEFQVCIHRNIEGVENRWT